MDDEDDNDSEENDDGDNDIDGDGDDVKMKMTMMITMVAAMMVTERCGKGCCAKTFQPSGLSRRTNLKSLAPTFKVIGHTSVLAFSRYSVFAAPEVQGCFLF